MNHCAKIFARNGRKGRFKADPYGFFCGAQNIPQIFMEKEKGEKKPMAPICPDGP